MKKYIFILFISFAFLSCNKDKEAAQIKLKEARNLYENLEYGSAKKTLDELKTSYPKEIATQKEGLLLMREIELNEQKRNIVFCDSMIKIKNAEADSIKQYFTLEKTSYDSQGRYIDKTYNPQLGYAPKYIKIHVNEDADLVLSSVHKGTPIKHNQIKISTSTGEYAETEIIPYDGGANYSFKDIDGNTYETVSFQKGRDNGVIQFIYNYANSKITLEYLGGKKSNPIVLTDKQKNALVNTVNFSDILKDIHQFTQEKEKAEKRLEYLETKIAKH